MLIIFALVILQLAFVSGLPSWLAQFNLLLIFLVFSLEWSKDETMIWWFLLVGFLFDLYWSGSFGFYLIFWPLIWLWAKFLSANFFTNRSLYSFLGLAFFTAVFYYFLLNIMFYLRQIFSGKSSVIFFLVKNFWVNLAAGLVINLLAVIILFYLVNLASDRLRPVFIIKK
ncbi:MAG TPA: hypothetical protein VMD74_05405 [Candidatus Methylomirabilis sp.]|nr:hypothetical protein [Candidatus Methylomirabilis sp.]